MSGTPSELATSEVPVSEGLSVVPDTEAEVETRAPAASFPPYPPYATEPAPPSVAEAIIAGRGLRLQHKSKPRKSLRPLPKPAKPKSPKATDVKMSLPAMRAHARCLRKHGAILTDRLERISKPRRRTVIYFWRDNAQNLTPYTISRLRSMLDADEPFKPDQAYEYFVNLKKTEKKAAATAGVRAIKKDILAMCGDKKFAWARNATVAFARGIQQRLSRPGRYALADGMLRLSDIILHDMCGYMRMRTPSRRCTNPKAKFMMEMSDKIAVWIDEILTESDDRMLMMDFDEDDEVERFYSEDGKPPGNNPAPAPGLPTPASPAATPKTLSTASLSVSKTASSPASSVPGTPTTTPDVLLEAKGGGLYGAGDSGAGDDGAGSAGKRGVGGPRRAHRAERPAYLKFDGKMRKAFDILTDAMEAKGNEKLLSVGKFDQTYHEGSNELKNATDLTATEYSAIEGEKIYNKLEELVKNITPPDIAEAMTDMLEICTDYLAQNAEYNKEKGPAFKLLIKELNKNSSDKMYEKGKIKRTNAQAAKELEMAKGLEADHDEPNLSQAINAAMKRIITRHTPKNLKSEMDETVDICSKYLSQKAVDDNERGPAFDLLIKELQRQGDKPFSEFPALSTRNVAAYVLKSAPGLGSSVPDPKTADEFKVALHKAADTATPKVLKSDMNDVVDLCGNYLSAFIRDRGPAMNSLLGMMRSKPKTVFAKRNAYTMDYGTGADEVENAPYLVPYLPIKDIADEGKENLTKDMKDVTPPALKLPVQALIKDVSKHLSQLVALRSGVAGDRYKMSFLAAVKKSMGKRPLYKYKSYKKTYSDAADELKTADSIPLKNLSPPEVALGHEINSEMKRGIPTKLAPTVVEDIQPTMDIAAMHLAKIGVEKGDAMNYVVHLMQDKGEENLGKLQGYEQTYSDGARRLEKTLTLQSSIVDVAAYSSVKGKLTDMTKEKPDERFAAVLPDIIDDSANFLAAPIPETNAEQKQVLSDLMGRKGDTVVGEKQAYRLTYEEGGEDIKSSPVGVTRAHDEQKNKEMVKQIQAVIPDKKMEMVLKESTKEGAAYLTDAIEGRGQALEVIETGLKKEGQKEFINVGKLKKDHKQIGEMLHTAPNLKGDHPSPVILENVEYHFDVLPKDAPADKPLAQEHMKSMTNIAAQFIASKATDDCGLDAQQLAALDAAGFNAEAKAAAEARRLAAIAAGPGGKIGAGDGTAAAGGAVSVDTAGAGGTVGVGTGTAEAGSPSGVFGGLSGVFGGPSGVLSGVFGETEEQRRRRLSEAEEYRKHEEEEKKRFEEQERLKRESSKYKRGVLGADYDPEHSKSLDILHQELKARGPEVFYEQPKTSLTHAQASDWLADPDPVKIDKSVKDSTDTARLHMKFERKLSGVVKDKTPPELKDSMQAERSPQLDIGLPQAPPLQPVLSPPTVESSPQLDIGLPQAPPLQPVLSPPTAERSPQLDIGLPQALPLQPVLSPPTAERIPQLDIGLPQALPLQPVLSPPTAERSPQLDIGLPQAPPLQPVLSHPTAERSPQVDIGLLPQAPPLQPVLSPPTAERSPQLDIGLPQAPPLQPVLSPPTDVVIEAARKTAECFVAANYNTLVKDDLVAEMQMRGNEILTEVDGAAETYFFAAQRVKRKDSAAAQKEPCYKVANELGKKLDDMIRSRPMPRKLNMSMKEHVKDTSKFLSAVVTKPDDYIEAYVAMLAEMENAGDAVLIEGEIQKSYKQSATYLRQLTTFKDTIGLPNKPMKADIQSKLKHLMAHAPPTGSKGSSSAMDLAITESAGLLVSYVMLQAAKAAVLDILLKEMQDAGKGALLRHGRLLKSYKDGADMLLFYILLSGKTTDELTVPNDPDPVVSRKIQIKLTNLMKDETPAQFRALMTEVIEDATKYLAVHLLEPRVLKVCKCYKNVFVQCELWCDEILRRVARPCCTCSRHVSVQALQDLAPTDFLTVTPDQSRVLAPGVEISFKPCPYQARSPKGGVIHPCPAQRLATSYLLYETTHKKFGSDSMPTSPSPSTSGAEPRSPTSSLSSISPLRKTKQFLPLKSLLLEMHVDSAQSIRKQQEQLQSFETEKQNRTFEKMKSPSYFASTSSDNFGTSTSQSDPATCDRCQQLSTPISETSKISNAKSGYSSRTPITSAEHMVDWDSTMVSLLWNVLAWRDWIQEIVDHALAYQHSSSFATASEEKATSWLSFYRRVTTEALQWRQYSVFSRQLTTRLHLRYRDKEIVSPKRSNVKTKTYMECQETMLGIIDMFNRWTQWLNLVVKETDSLQQKPGSVIPLYQMRWIHLKSKVMDYSKDWANYNKVLKVSWEQKYSSVIADYLPSWKKPGPVWVASACGAVPSGAVAAGIYDREVIWVARTMHRCTMLPATLLPSKHYCIVYAEGKIHRYNKYQVMCNAEVNWVAWRGGSVNDRAVCVAPGMHIGRVHYHGDHLLGAVHEPNYHCHVVIFGRPFAFTCFELLMLAGDKDQ